MITTITNRVIVKEGKEYIYCDFTGKSTDTKPTTGIANGSTFYEMDTQELYMLDADTMTWIKQ